MKRALLAAAALVAGFPPFAAFVFRHRPYAPQPPAVSWKTGGLTLRYTGISGYELSDGKTTLLLDPVVSRPPIWSLPFRKFHPEASLSAAEFPKADYILIDHGHFDHAADAPEIAKRTGATIVGSESVARLARGQGVPPGKIVTAKGGETLTLGSFTVTVGRSRHARILFVEKPMEGLAPETSRPLWFWEYRQDGALTYHLSSKAGTVWFHPTSTFSAGELSGRRADTLILGVTGEDWTDAMLDAVAAETPGVKLVLPTHYDNFFQPKARGLSLMPLLKPSLLESMARRHFPSAAFAVLDYDKPIALP